MGKKSLVDQLVISAHMMSCTKQILVSQKLGHENSEDSIDTVCEFVFLFSDRLDNSI